MSYPDPAYKDHALPEIFFVLLVFILGIFAMKLIGELPCRDEKPKAVPTTPLLPKPPFKPRTKQTPIRLDRVASQYSR